MATLFAEQNRSSVPLAQVPHAVQAAILAVEDENFYSHNGINLRATLRALFTNVSSGEVEQGGSTITMQLVKNALLDARSATSTARRRRPCWRGGSSR